MNATLLKALIGLLLVGVLLFRSIASLLKERNAGAVIQSLGAGFLMIVVFAHICEAAELVPSMQWGLPHSAGHYLDFWSAVLGLALFLIGYSLPDQFENVIVLSDEFYREITVHPIPADLEAVKVLAAAPAVLDLFMWLSYRCFVAKGREIIPLFGCRGLARQIGCIEYARPRRFREKLDGWLETIRVLWPECPARISSDGTGLEVDRAAALLVEQKAG